MSGIALQQAEGSLLFAIIYAYGFVWLFAALRRSRPGFRIGTPVAVGFSLRLVASAAIGAIGLNSTLRGGDESTYLAFARSLASQPLGRGDLPHGQFQLHTILFTLQLKLGFVGVGTLRLTQIAISMLGIVLIVAAIHDLGSPRAARLGAWLLVLNPTAVFFDSALLKEPNLQLAAGLVAFGGTLLWRRLDVRGILLCVLAGLIAVETRSYAGWFLVAAAALVLLHASLRHARQPLKALPAIYGILTLMAVAAPAVLQASSGSNLKRLQASQIGNATGAGTGKLGSANSDNLALEKVDYSTRGAILSNLPRRVSDVLTRPYPWQLGDTSQRVGAVGTLIAYVVVLMLLAYALLSRGQILARAGPLLYPLLFLLMAYSLSVGNAGTGFRYRSSILPLAIAALVVLRDHVVNGRSAAVAASGEPAGRTRTPAEALLAGAAMVPLGGSRG